MLAVWEPSKQQFRTLIPSAQIHGGTANYPRVYKPVEICYCDEILEEGAILIPMSDGIADHLPLKPIIGVDDETTGIKKVELNTEYMTDLLIKPPPVTTPDECITRITKTALKNSQLTLNESLKVAEVDKTHIQHGDDIHIVGTRVPIKSVEIFRPLLKEGIEITHDSVLKQINKYLSLYPKEQHEKKFNELIDNRNDIILNLSQTKGVSKEKIQTLKSTLSQMTFANQCVDTAMNTALNVSDWVFQDGQEVSSLKKSKSIESEFTRVVAGNLIVEQSSMELTKGHSYAYKSFYPSKDGITADKRQIAPESASIQGLSGVTATVIMMI